MQSIAVGTLISLYHCDDKDGENEENIEEVNGSLISTKDNLDI